MKEGEEEIGKKGGERMSLLITRGDSVFTLRKGGGEKKKEKGICKFISS